MRARWGTLTAGLVALALLIIPSAAYAAVDDLELASRIGEFGAGGDDDSQFPDMSNDGRFLAFASKANNLSPEDTDGAVQDIFVRDLENGVTSYVSRADGDDGAPGTSHSHLPAISGNGRYVSFTTDSQLDPADVVITTDVYVRDRWQDDTEFVSRASGVSGAPSNGGSSRSAISADGRFVAFDSTATNLPDDADATADVFVRDRLTDETILVSRATDGVNPGAKGDDTSLSPSISADGRYVAFMSWANNLSADDNDSAINFFVRDLDTGTTTLVNRADGVSGAADNGGAFFNNVSAYLDISADGRHVAFSSFGTNLVTTPLLTALNTFVRDLDASTTTLASLNDAGTPANGATYEPSISATGRFVSFSGLFSATNLSDEDDDSAHDIFLRDLLAGRTKYISRATGPNGVPGNFHSGESSISGDGGMVLFHAGASNLHPDDANGFLNDVFVRELDVAPPAAPVIIGKPKAKTKKRSAVFTFTGEAGATFECKLDGGAFVPCTSGVAYRVKPGRHTFQVRQTDAAGNTGPAATYSWKVVRR